MWTWDGRAENFPPFLLKNEVATTLRNSTARQEGKAFQADVCADRGRQWAARNCPPPLNSDHGRKARRCAKLALQPMNENIRNRKARRERKAFQTVARANGALFPRWPGPGTRAPVLEYSAVKAKQHGNFQAYIVKNAFDVCPINF